jgi:hypothetical protein
MNSEIGAAIQKFLGQKKITIVGASRFLFLRKLLGGS